MNLSCYLVDDEFHAIEVLKTYIAGTPGLELKGYATDPRLALHEVAGPGAPDITFVDIDMPELSGLDFAGLVSLYTCVVFTTSYPEYAIEAFEKEAFGYLLKPISYETFLKTVHRVKRQLRGKGHPATGKGAYFYIRSDIKGKVIRVVTEEIFYIEAAQNYVTIHFSAGKQMAYLTMEEIAEKLPGETFARVHRSFILHTGRIKSMEQGRVTLENQAVIPLGRMYKEPLLEAIKDLVVQSKRTGGGPAGDR
ncbi:MAG: hypothetical protein JWQ66_4682 [Mucilaginibacter sp.]|nr:hypothetical protein [Mucilaginibacter sp.]